MNATDFAEIVLIVEDVKVTARFYEEVVGIEPHRPTDDGCSLNWMLSV